jgi:hypothetical protein
MNGRKQGSRAAATQQGQAMSEYLVGTALVGLALIVPFGSAGPVGRQLAEAFLVFLRELAWLVAIG